MKTIKLRKSLMATAAGAALALGMTTNAMAIPQFQVDPDSNPITLNNFYGTALNGGSSERLVKGVSTLTTTFGYLAFSGFTNDGPLGPFGPVAAIDSGLGVTYGLYLTFNLVANWNGDGTFGGLGSNYTLGSLNFNVYQDADFASALTRTKFTPATLTTDASISQFSGDVLLGTGSLLAGLAGINGAGGAFLNSTTSYLNTAAGNAFFVDPSPFYTLAFNAFNNTSQGVQIGPDSVAISAAGVVDFNRVPEPTTVALLGLGLLGLGLSRRRKDA